MKRFFFCRSGGRTSLLSCFTFSFLSCSAFLLLISTGLPAFSADNSKENCYWNEFLGPNGNGIAPPSEKSIPLSWFEKSAGAEDETLEVSESSDQTSEVQVSDSVKTDSDLSDNHFDTSANIVWKVPIEGRGWSSPVVWKNQLWLTNATEDGKQLFILCFDTETGKKLFDIKYRDVENPLEINAANSYASMTPVIEEGRVFCSFANEGVVCLKTDDGTVLWDRRDISGVYDSGPGASPILWNDLLILSVDASDEQYVIALDKKNGKTVWRTERSYDFGTLRGDFRKSFNTPSIVVFEGTEYLLTPGAQAAYIYDPNTGKERMRFYYEGSFSNIMRPLCWNGNAIFGTTFPVPTLYVLPVDAEGQLTEDDLLWTLERNVGKTANPILIDDFMYQADQQGTISCINMKNGRIAWAKRVGGVFWASPIMQNNRIYFFDDTSKTTVIEVNPKKCVILEANELEDGCMGTPAVVDNAIYIRTKKALYKIQDKQ